MLSGIHTFFMLRNVSYVRRYVSMYLQHMSTLISPTHYHFYQFACTGSMINRGPAIHLWNVLRNPQHVWILNDQMFLPLLFTHCYFIRTGCMTPGQWLYSVRVDMSHHIICVSLSYFYIFKLCHDISNLLMLRFHLLS